MAFTENLAPFFSISDFAVAALWKGTTSVNGIFDNGYLEAIAGVTEGSAPTFTCSAADVPSVAHGDALVVNAASYQVRGVEPDGTGVVLLRLEAQ